MDNVEFKLSDTPVWLPIRLGTDMVVALKESDAHNFVENVSMALSSNGDFVCITIVTLSGTTHYLAGVNFNVK